MQPTQPDTDFVMLLVGRIATNDGSPIPHDMLVERICSERVRQQVYASPNGDFSMQMGSRNDSFIDATADAPSPERVNNKTSLRGIPRSELTKCELQASAAGFRSNRINLFELTPSSGSADVGSIIVQRTTKIKGITLSAEPYKAPPNARKAYEKGLDAENKRKLAEARKCFEQAVALYPKYASAWFQLGMIFERENQKDSARDAYARATAIDMKFLPPYLSLASLAFEAGDWAAVLQFTVHILDVDPFNYGDVNSYYLLDLDELNPAEVYFYNAVANYKLNKIEEAEKSALKAERTDLLTNFPQLHVLLAEIFTQRKNYAGAILELRSYLELTPHAKDAYLIRERLAKLEERNRSASAAEKPVQD
jgi:tetratricopeptide (TPR) repeat protein